MPETDHVLTHASVPALMMVLSSTHETPVTPPAWAFYHCVKIKSSVRFAAAQHLQTHLDGQVAQRFLYRPDIDALVETS